MIHYNARGLVESDLGDYFFQPRALNKCKLPIGTHWNQRFDRQMTVRRPLVVARPEQVVYSSPLLESKSSQLHLLNSKKSSSVYDFNRSASSLPWRYFQETSVNRARRLSVLPRFKFVKTKFKSHSDIALLC